MLFFMFSFSCVLRFISVRASLSVLFDMYLMYDVAFLRLFFRHCCVLQNKSVLNTTLRERTLVKGAGRLLPCCQDFHDEILNRALFGL